MSRDLGAHAEDDPIKREAAAWFARMRAEHATERERSRFARWLNGDPRHRAAYERIESLWSMAGSFTDREELQTAVATELRTMQGAERSRAPSRIGRRWIYGATAAASIAGLTLFVLPNLLGQRYVTSIGEQRTVALEDGSKITLNTDSQMRVRYTDGERRVELQRGEAYFRVAKDAGRPFTVLTHRGSIQAVGTEFDVHLHERNVTVMLVEGRVLLRETHSGGATALATGQSAVLDDDTRAPTPFAAPVEGAIAWLQGRVVFDNVALADAVAELNRYSQARIELDDAGLGALRITGVFATDRTETFVNAVTAAFPISAMRRPDGGYLLKNQSARPTLDE